MKKKVNWSYMVVFGGFRGRDPSRKMRKKIMCGVLAIYVFFEQFHIFYEIVKK